MTSKTLNPNFRFSQLARLLLEANWTPSFWKLIQKRGRKESDWSALFSSCVSTESVKLFQRWWECLHYVLPSLKLRGSPKAVHDGVCARLHVLDCSVYVLDIGEVRIHLRPPQVLEFVHSGELPRAAQRLELDIEGFRRSSAARLYTGIGRPDGEEGPYHSFILSVARPEVIRDGARVR